MNDKKNNRKGFTIVELVIVIAVIAILATVLVPTFGNVIKNAKNTALIQEIKNEHTNYTVAYADKDGYSDTIYIKIDDTYYLVENGEIVMETIDGREVPDAQDAPTSGVVFCAGCDKVLEYKDGAWTNCTCDDAE